jgi:hypothetical protein
MLGVISRIFICLYWVVLLGFNASNFVHNEALRRNKWICALIVVNFIVAVITFILIF